MIIVVLVFNFRANTPQPPQVSLNDVAQKVMNGQVDKIVVDGDNLDVSLADGTKAISRKEPTSTMVDQLVALGVTPAELSSSQLQIEIKQPSDWNTIISSGDLHPAGGAGGWLDLAHATPGSRQRTTKPCHSERAGRACSPGINQRSLSKTWPALRRPRKSSRRWLSS